MYVPWESQPVGLCSGYNRKEIPNGFRTDLTVWKLFRDNA